MEQLYNKIKENLQKIDFCAIWQDFKPVRFALYNDENVYLDGEIFKTDGRFLGNTAIYFNGERIAIWKVFKPCEEDTDIITANIVHEMFHAFQYNNGETRFTNDLVLLDYPSDVKNYCLRFEENVLLANVYMLEDDSQKRDAFVKFIKTRKYRIEQTGDITLQEFCAETVEGMAEYAGSCALKQLSEDKFNARMAEYTDILNSYSGIFFDIRKMCYYSGTILCMVLRNLGIGFWHKTGEEKTPLFPFILKNPDIAGLDMVTGKETNALFENENLHNVVFKYINGKKEQFLDLESMDYETVTGDFIICGYDPMNMLRYEDKILFKRFVMLMENGKEKPLFINGPVIVKLKENSYNKSGLYMKNFR